jgi:hypothetical protein
VIRGRLEGEGCGIPHLAKNERDAPNFLYAALERTACAPFIKGKAHEVQGTHETTQEIGDVGHPAVVAGIEPELAAVQLKLCGRHSLLEEKVAIAQRVGSGRHH